MKHFRRIHSDDPIRRPEKLGIRLRAIRSPSLSPVARQARGAAKQAFDEFLSRRKPLHTHRRHGSRKRGECRRRSQ